MAKFDKVILTDNGRNLIAKAVANSFSISFSKMKVGDGDWSGVSDPNTLNDLVNPKLELAINKVERNNDVIRVSSILSNSSLSEGFFITEIGLYANDPDLGEILYAVAHAEIPDYLPSSAQPVEELIDFLTTVGNADCEITVNFGGVVITYEDLQNHNLDECAHPNLFIHRPVIVSPSNGATDQDGYVESSPFQSSCRFRGTHEFSDWEFATDESFSNIVESSYNDSVNLTSYHFNNWQPLTTYYVRVRYISDGHVSEWSNPVSFTTTNAYIETPTVSTTDSGTLYPTFNLTPFTAVGFSDNWLSTDWEIATDPSFNNVIYSYTETNPSKQDVLSIDSDILEVDSTYYIRAKYNGDQGHSSNWSNPLEYRTELYQIEYSVPSSANEGETISFTVYHDNGKTWDSSSYSLKGYVSGGNLIITGFNVEWELPLVQEDSTYDITLWVEDLNGVRVSNVDTKSVLVVDTGTTLDSIITIVDFSDYEINDLWDTTAQGGANELPT